MPEDSIKRLLVKMSLSLEDFQKGIQQVRTALDQLRELEKRQTAERTAQAQQERTQRQKDIDLRRAQQQQEKTAAAQRAQEEAARIKNVIALTQAQAAGLNLSKQEIATLKQKNTEDAVRLQVLNAQLRVMASQGTYSKEALSLVKQQIMQEQASLALKTAQLRSAQVAGGPGEKGFVGSMMGGALQGVSQGLFGGGMLGMMTTGVAVGTLVAGVVSSITQKLREMVEESTRLDHITSFFEGLAGRQGLDAKKTLEALQKATHGLVDDVDLMVFATKALQQNLPVTTESLAKMAGAVTDLARAQGQDAAQAMSMLERSLTTGMFRYVAFTLGLDKATQALLVQANRLPSNVRAMAEYQIILDSVTKKLDAVGRPTLTFAEQLTRISEAVGTFFQQLAIRMTRGDAFSELGARLSALVDWIGVKTPAAVEVAAQAINALLRPLSVFISGLEGAFGGLQTVFGIVVDQLLVIPRLLSDINKSAVKSDAITSWFDELRIHVSSLSNILLTLLEGWKLFWDRVEKDVFVASAFGAVLKAFLTEGWDAAAAEWERRSKQFDELGRKQAAGTKKIEGTIHGEPGTPVGPKAPTPFESQIDPQEEQRLARERTRLRLLQLEGEKEQLKASLDEQTELYRVFYEQGEISLEDFAKASIRLRREQAEAEKNLIDEQTAAKLQEIEDTRQIISTLLGQVDKQLVDAKSKLAQAKGTTTEPEWARQVSALEQQRAMYQSAGREDELKRAVVRQEGANQKAKVDIQERAYERSENEKLLGDETAARKIYEQEILKLTKEGIDERVKEAESEFKRGLIGADAYLAERRTLIQEQLTATQDALKEEFASSEKSDKDIADFHTKMVNAEMDADKQRQALELQNDAIRVEGMQNQYKRQSDFLKAQASLAAGQAKLGVPGAAGTEAQVTSQQIALNNAYLEQLGQMRTEVAEGSEQWYKIVTAIETVSREQDQLNEKMISLHDIAGQVANAFSLIGQSMPNRSAREWFQQMAQILKQFSEFNRYTSQFQGGAMGSLRSIGQSFMGMIHPGRGIGGAAPQKTGIDKFNADVENAGTSARSLGDSLQARINDFRQLAQQAQARAQEFGDKINAAAQRVAKSLEDAGRAADEFAKKLRGEAPQQPPGGEPDVTTPGVEVPQTRSEVPGLLKEDKSEDGTAKHVAKTGTALDRFSGWLDKINSKWADWHNSFQNFANGIGQWAGQIGGAVGAVTGAKSTGGGILSGGLAGAQLGSNFGPIGTAIGAGVGMVMGGIIGHKRAEAAKEAEAIKGRLDAIKEAVQNGTMTMGTAITQTEAVSSGMISKMRGGNKKERAQVPALQQEATAQIQQLLDQQQKILNDLHAQLGVLLDPTQYQQIVQSISSIIAKYQEFANAAAGNTQQVALANQFLLESLKQYALTLGSDVNDAQQTAVEDAIKYNDLLVQRQQLLNQTQMQEYDILTQGVLQRTRTQAQIKGQQIEALRQQVYGGPAGPGQLDQLDQEIALTKYKVESEGKIFNLAQTRVGLEAQLLVLQEAAYDKQALNVDAMVQTLQKLQDAIASGQLPAGLFNALGGIDINALNQLLGLPSVPSQGYQPGQAYIQNEPTLYAEFIRMMTTKDENFAANVLAAAQTPFNSAQRQALFSEIKAGNLGRILADKGLTSGDRNDPNWVAFQQWLLSGMQAVTMGATEPLQSFAVGGPVTATGPIFAHEGEYVLSNRDTSAISNAITQLSETTALTTHQQIYDLATARISMENELISKQAMQTQAEMQRMDVMATLLEQMSKMSNYGVLSTEGGLAKVYELRGRYGSAGFRRESL